LFLQDDERYSRLSPTERQEEYLRLLNEKNRLKRQMEQRRRTREEQSNQDRERGEASMRMKSTRWK
jgi:hypothetical protein